MPRAHQSRYLSSESLDFRPATTTRVAQLQQCDAAPSRARL